jgi:hypothetical protein
MAKLTAKQEQLTMIKEWFDNTELMNQESLNLEDYQLAYKVYAALELDIPKFVTDGLVFHSEPKGGVELKKMHGTAKEEAYILNNSSVGDDNTSMWSFSDAEFKEMHKAVPRDNVQSVSRSYDFKPRGRG